MAGNPFGDIGGRYLADILGKTNNTLRVLDIHNSEMSATVEQDIVDYLRANRCVHNAHAGLIHCRPHALIVAHDKLHVLTSAPKRHDV